MAPLKAYLAKQLRHPSGWAGRLVLRLLNRENAGMNAIALERLDVQAGQHVLEIGFGGGVLIDRLLQTGPLQITAIDVSQTAVDAAKKRFRGAMVEDRPSAIAANSLVLHQANAETMLFPPDTFDAIISVNVVYFWSDVLEVFNRCQRCLKPGGTLVIAYTSKVFLEAQQATQYGFQAYEVNEMETHLATAGFDAIETLSGESRSNETFFCTSGIATNGPI